MIQKTKREIIDETSKYTFATRAEKYGGCYYLHEATGNKCGVGRCMIDPKENWYGRISEIHSIAKHGAIRISLLENGSIEHLLQPEYRGHDVNFWGDLQVWHDNRHFWTADGMSEAGKEKRQELVDKWCKDAS